MLERCRTTAFSDTPSRLAMAMLLRPSATSASTSYCLGVSRRMLSKRSPRPIIASTGPDPAKSRYTVLGAARGDSNTRSMNCCNSNHEAKLAEVPDTRCSALPVPLATASNPARNCTTNAWSAGRLGAARPGVVVSATSCSPPRPLCLRDDHMVTNRRGKVLQDSYGCSTNSPMQGGPRSPAAARWPDPARGFALRTCPEDPLTGWTG